MQKQLPEVPLIPRLDEALSYGDRLKWEEAVRACHDAGKPDLPDHRRRIFTPLAERLDRAYSSSWQ